MAFDLPWFPFYVADFFQDENVAAMDHAAIGAYLRLLGHQWVEGSIPADQFRLRGLLKVNSEAWADLWPQLKPCFVKQIRHKDRLVNVRLDTERAKALNLRENLRKVRSAAARKRWNGRASE